MANNKSLTYIVLLWEIEEFEIRILEGMRKSRECLNVVQIMRDAFGEHYEREFSPILCDQLNIMFKQTIQKLIADKKISECNKLSTLRDNIFTKCYQII
jgi:hypothetical protein